jgi:cytochrome c2
VPNQSKYIISAFLIITLVFAGFYFISRFILKEKGSPIENLSYQTTDTSKQRYDGKIIFQNKCAACHILFMDATGPDLIGFTRRGPWADKRKVLDYLTNPQKFYKENKSTYIEKLYEYNEVSHQIFLISQEEVDAIIRYLDFSKKK